MSVASTKAFYAQIAAGYLLAFALADEARRRSTPERPHELLDALRDLPDAMRAVLGRRAAIADDRAAPRAPAAATGPSSATAPNPIAARELRIKLSELCYKSIACDVTEDKKHIDLSSEPLILVCAAGLDGLERRRRRQGGRDLPRAQGRADRDRRRGRRAASPPRSRRSRCPRCTRDLDFVLVDDGRPPLRLRGRARHRRVGPAAARGPRRDRGGGDRPRRVRTRCSTGSRTTIEPACRVASSTACARASTTARSRPAPRCGSRRCCGTRPGTLPLDSYEIEHGKVGTPSTVVEDLTAALTAAIEELTRPVDAIKHQAKTVTVGISRSDETLLQVPLVAGGARRRCAARRPRATARCARSSTSTPRSTRSSASPATASTATSKPTTRTIHVVDQGGIARGLASRTEIDPSLRGTKHRVATAARGHRGAWAPRRPHARDRARGEGQRRPSGSRSCTCASPITLPADVDARRAPGLPGPLRRAAGRGHRDRADVRRRAARDRSRWSTCSPSRSTCSPTAGAPDG